MRDGGTIFALLTMLGAATVLIAWGGWVLDGIEEMLGEALDEAFGKSATARNIRQGGEPSNPASGGDADKPFSDHGEAGL